MSDKENKKLLLEQFLELSKQITNAFNQNQIEAANDLIDKKKFIIQRLKSMKDISNDGFESIIDGIKQNELENIVIAKKIQNDLKQEYTSISQSSKVNFAYQSDRNNQGKIIDFTE